MAYAYSRLLPSKEALSADVAAVLAGGIEARRPAPWHPQRHGREVTCGQRPEESEVSKQHYGALAGVIAGYVAFRILSLWAVRMAGDIGGHRRAGDIAVGVIVGAIPFAVLILFVLRQLRRPPAPGSRAVKVLFVGGWFVAGVVMGILPYSRMGTSLHLRLEETRDAPGFLHGVDVTIVVGMVVVLALLFLALRTRHEPASTPVEWMEHQFGDER